MSNDEPDDKGLSDRERFVGGRVIPREPEVPALSEKEIAHIGQAVFVDCSPEPSDLILVLGSSKGRWDLAAQLYLSGLAPVVITTGRRGIAYFDTGRPLSHIIRDALVEHGVPEPAIIVSDQSDHTDDDVRLGLEVARQQGVRTSSILFASKAHHAGRVWRSFAQWAPETRISCYTWDAEYEDVPVRARDWWEHPTSRARVYGEYLRIARYYGGVDSATDL